MLKRAILVSAITCLAFLLPLCAAEDNKSVKTDVKVSSAVKPSAPAKECPVSKNIQVAQAVPAVKKAETPASKTPVAAKKEDSLVVIARVLEIPGKFAPNDLYNYVYVMKYRVLQVVSGSLASKEICVGHYNPLIPRAQIKDKMAAFVKGNVEKFEVGGKHRLVLAQPIEKYWNDAKEDEFIDIDDADKFFALKADVAQ
jgi:hypothetical protein